MPRTGADFDRAAQLDLGFLPATSLTQQAAVCPAAVARQYRRLYGVDQPSEPLDVAEQSARAYNRATGEDGGYEITHFAGDDRSEGLIQAPESFLRAPQRDQSQPAVREGADFKIDIAEDPGHLQGSTGIRLEFGDVADLAAHHCDAVIALLDARTNLIHKPLGSAQPATRSQSVAARRLDLGHLDGGAGGVGDVVLLTIEAIRDLEVSESSGIVVEHTEASQPQECPLEPGRGPGGPGSISFDADSSLIKVAGAFEMALDYDGQIGGTSHSINRHFEAQLSWDGSNLNVITIQRRL